ncbi:hypothetical protein AQUCO_07700062v1 [Aquilegia coerulea]|uniref:Uncharacterized protein n=1 Tax=Aquilegia coerulea TaxID=218851 RepID=A0A2G5C8B8_AQUCA|nr:hypothetical protein AQUCO_07700062v1 [Aquilegia coerulea]
MSKVRPYMCRKNLYCHVVHFYPKVYVHSRVLYMFLPPHLMSHFVDILVFQNSHCTMKMPKSSQMAHLSQKQKKKNPLAGLAPEENITTTLPGMHSVLPLGPAGNASTYSSIQ